MEFFLVRRIFVQCFSVVVGKKPGAGGSNDANDGEEASHNKKNQKLEVDETHRVEAGQTEGKL